MHGNVCVTCNDVVGIGLLLLWTGSAWAADASASGRPADDWPPILHYSLGDTQQPPRLRPDPGPAASAGVEQLTVVGERRAPMPHVSDPDTTTPQSVFNIGGPPLRAPADCNQNYTTVAGQPATLADFAGAVGVRSCYF